MLVLSPRKNEAIRIADDVEIRVLEVRNGRVRLGIRAPREVPVMRSELVTMPVAAADDVLVSDDVVSVLEFMPAVPSMPRLPR